MREELNRHEAGLNEQALSGVSGGKTNDVRSQAVIDSGSLCYTCSQVHLTKVNCAQNHRNDLIQYLLDHGLGSVRDYKQCPYYDR